ncbi:uncharacterized protein LOC130748069 [Lotus japonicus]|uniref:uncharacterized protein LOC130748069 n=1 Tax=Lotus japonicus TaxID=34305 RepID=UPI002583A07D|nr:uncharacterized protein LOC130748069 [Lotus japonicus]
MSLLKYFSPLMLLLVLLVFVASSRGAKVVEVGEICKQSKNVSFCITLLNSSPSGKDLVSLTQYTIDVAHANVTNTITLIKSLIAKSVDDPKANAHYKTCLFYFVVEGGALNAIEDAQQCFNKGGYDGVGSSANQVYARVDACLLGDDGPDPGLTPFPDTSLLPNYADVIKQVAHIILFLSHLLIGD